MKGDFLCFNTVNFRNKMKYISWNMHCLSSNNIGINSENFLKKMQHLLDEHAPLKTSTKITFTKLPWITLIFEKK